MNVPDSPTSTGSDTAAELKALQNECQALRAQMHALLIAAIVLAGSLDIYLFRQLRLVRRESANLSQRVTDYEKTGAPKINDFVAKLRDFSKANPDLKPILDKYITNPPTAYRATNVPSAK